MKMKMGAWAALVCVFGASVASAGDAIPAAQVAVHCMSRTNDGFSARWDAETLNTESKNSTLYQPINEDAFYTVSVYPVGTVGDTNGSLEGYAYRLVLTRVEDESALLNPEKAVAVEGRTTVTAEFVLSARTAGSVSWRWWDWSKRQFITTPLENLALEYSMKTGWFSSVVTQVRCGVSDVKFVQ